MTDYSFFFFFFLIIAVVLIVVLCCIRCRVVAARRGRQQRMEEQEARRNELEVLQQHQAVHNYQYYYGNAAMNNDGGAHGNDGVQYYGNSYTYGGNNGNGGNPSSPPLQAGTVLMVSDGTGGGGTGVLGPQAAPLAQFFPQAQVMEYRADNNSGGNNGHGNNSYYTYVNAPPQLQQPTEDNAQAAPYGCATYLPRSPSQGSLKTGDNDGVCGKEEDNECGEKESDTTTTAVTVDCAKEAEAKELHGKDKGKDKEARRGTKEKESMASFGFYAFAAVGGVALLVFLGVVIAAITVRSRRRRAQELSDEARRTQEGEPIADEAYDGSNTIMDYYNNQYRNSTGYHHAPNADLEPLSYGSQRGRATAHSNSESGEQPVLPAAVLATQRPGHRPPRSAQFFPTAQDPQPVPPAAYSRRRGASRADRQRGSAADNGGGKDSSYTYGSGYYYNEHGPDADEEEAAGNSEAEDEEVKGVGVGKGSMEELTDRSNTNEEEEGKK